jgi:tRNA (guanine37-N1)-methyltransferase
MAEQLSFTVLTLFPDIIKSYMSSSILGRATESGVIGLDVIDIRDFSENKHNRVDDYPYGGGAGMVMEPGPVMSACERAKGLHPDKKSRLIYLSPIGRPFTQEIAKELAREESLIFLCGHYEGIDERALTAEVDDYISLGDFVLTGGELPALAVMDAVSRLIPGVLNNDESAGEESFENGLLEYPQYTRPEDFKGAKVPEVLLSGHHANIDLWRLAMSLLRTHEYRPDMLEGFILEKLRRRALLKYIKDNDLFSEEDREIIRNILNA